MKLSLENKKGAARAQTRTDDHGSGALSPPLVDVAPIHRRKARRERASLCAESSHRIDRLRLQSRRAADVHLRAEKCSAAPALVVVLHGCTQTAAGYDLGAGWSTLAERYGFVLLLPEQTPANNPKTCFNWFLPGDTARDRGEALSIRQMIEKTIGAHGVDRKRVFITGLSAGGAMTAAMLADLSGGVRRGRDHRGTAVWHCGQCAAGVREHVPGKAAHREGMGRSGAACVGASRPVAARVGLAWRSRRDRQADECRRLLQQWSRCARDRGSAGRRQGRRLSAQGVAP